MGKHYSNPEIIGGGQPQRPLGPTTATVSMGVGTTIAITGLSYGETVQSVIPDGSVSNGTSVVITLNAPGTVPYTVVTSNGRTLVISVSAAAASLPSFAPEAETLSIRTASVGAGTPVPDSTLYSMNQFIKTIKAAGIFTKAKGIYFPAAESQAQALINWKSPGTFDLIVRGTPIFVPYDGWTTTAVANYLDTQIPFNTLAQNDTCMAFWSKTTSVAGTGDMGVVDGTNGMFLIAKVAAASATMRAMGAAITTIGTAAQWDGYGLTVANRNSASSFEAYHNGVLISTPAQTSVAPASTLPVTLLKANGGSSASGQKHSFAYVGQSLTATQIRVLHAAVNTYLESMFYGPLLQFDPGVAPTNVSANVVLYGADIGTLLAAIALKKAGKSVAIVGGWRERRVGGMSAGGLGFTDYLNDAGLGGLARDIITDMNTMSGKSDTTFPFEPRYFTAAMYKRLTDRVSGLGIPIYWSTGIKSVTTSNAKVTSFTTNDGRTFTGSYFGDGSYELDFARAAGLTTAIGRDTAGTGAEAKAGYRGILTAAGGSSHQFLVNVSPFATDGVSSSGLLPGVHVDPGKAVGSYDPRTEGYNIRMIWTNNGTRKVPFSSAIPRNYNKLRYELLLREMAQRTALGAFPALNDIFLINSPSLDSATSVFDVNSFGGMASDFWDSGTNYVSAGTDPVAREAVYQDYLDYINGLIYLLAYDASDARVPTSVRNSILTYGWDGRHFTDPYPGDTLYMPPQFYVRSHTRVVGDFVLDANDVVAADGTTPRSLKTISTISYNMDGHHNQTIVDNSVSPARAWNTGNIEDLTSGAADKITPLPYEAMLPKRAECTNLALMWSGSMTALAFSAARMEFTYGQIGQSMGLACSLAIDGGNIPLQDVSYTNLRAALMGAGDSHAPVLPTIN